MKPLVRRWALPGGPVLALGLMLAMTASGWQPVPAMAGGLTLLCAVWWIFEPIPIPATSLIPLGLFPLVGILNGEQVAQAYGNPLILLLMGGAMISKAMEKTGTHRRIALGMVRLFGGGGQRKLVFGFMLASAILSMWVSNTATTLMLLPVACAVLEKNDIPGLAVPLLLGIAYGSSIGGLGTPIGTPPNVIFLKVYAETTGVQPSFIGWMGWALPVVILFLPLAAMWLTRKLKSGQMPEMPSLPPWQSGEKRVMVVFACTAIAWMTLDEPFGGWTTWLDLPYANYAAVALTAVVAMFVIPDGKGCHLLDWESAGSINWGVLLLFAGGIAIAKAFVVTGISEVLGNMLTGLSALPTLLLIICLALFVTFLTEVTSNTATTSLLMPILAAAAVGAGLEPALLMLPAALSASCAFMLPVATAPNAIVFGTSQITMEDMVREGFVLNLMGAVVITLVCWVILA